MMLGQKNAELGKKALSNTVVNVLLIVAAMLAIMLVWYSVRQLTKNPGETPCFYFVNALKIEKACYLNENEVQIVLNRNFENLAIEKMEFSFSPGNALWEIKNEKCSDARTSNNNYGGYCKILAPGATSSYIFNTSGLEKQQIIEFAILNSGNLCSIGNKIITSSC